jgi:hypothetical protein
LSSVAPAAPGSPDTEGAAVGAGSFIMPVPLTEIFLH